MENTFHTYAWRSWSQRLSCSSVASLGQVGAMLGFDPLSSVSTEQLIWDLFQTGYIHRQTDTHTLPTGMPPNIKIQSGHAIRRVNPS